MAQRQPDPDFDAASQADMSQVYPDQQPVSGWGVGLIVFASFMMIMLGSFHFIAGLTAVLDDSFYVVRPGYNLSLDTTTWGWAHMIGGIILGLAGAFLLTGNIIARIIGIGGALVSALWSFYSIPYYPVWSIMIIALDIAVIWAIVAHGRDVSESSAA